jgi:hypothetical protein
MQENVFNAINSGKKARCGSRSDDSERLESNVTISSLLFVSLRNPEKAGSAMPFPDTIKWRNSFDNHCLEFSAVFLISNLRFFERLTIVSATIPCEIQSNLPFSSTKINTV